MGLTNSQYDQLMRLYQEEQSRQIRALDQRREEAYRKVPRLKELEDEIASDAVASAIARIDGQGLRADACKAQMRRAMEEKRQLLSESGFAPDHLELHYGCPYCRDTGYEGDHKCRCFHQKAVDLFYTQSGLRQVLERENFSTFSFAYYADDPKDERGGLTPRQNMHRIVQTSRRFIENFGHGGENLLFYGGTGLGKTFLTHCIARELIESAHSVIYYSAGSLFEALSRETFHTYSREDEADPFSQYLLDCDLLIIDDLGTEITNAFVSSRLFSLLNERISRGRSMIISTNLTLSQFADVYSERIFSRISSSFTLLGFYGDDIRILKKVQMR